MAQNDSGAVAPSRFSQSLNGIQPMIQVLMIPGKKFELKLDSEKSIAEILSTLNIEFRSNQGLSLNGEAIDPENFHKIYTIDGLITISSGARGEAPTPKLNNAIKFLKAHGFISVDGGKGDHMKFEGQEGETIILNRHNSDKKHICFRSARSLAKAFNVNIVKLYEMLS